jgi:hypothetical protein
MPEVRARELADALARVRKNRFPGVLPTTSTLSHCEQLEREAQNIKICFDYAADKLVEE